MKTKDSNVNLIDLHPKLSLILPFLDRWWALRIGYELIITSACDGKHSTRSRHYIGCAIDARTWTTSTSGVQIDSDKRQSLARDLRQDLEQEFGPYFQVLSESTHFHIAFDPREAVTWAHLV